MQIINSTTPLAHRRFNDGEPYANRYRSFAARVGTGTVTIRESFDGGTTYDTVEAVTATRSGEIVTFDKFIEIECTGNAIVLIGR
jgi:hypothetical protein